MEKQIIKDDLFETKVIMHRCLLAAEVTLEVMRRQLSEDWQVGQSSLRKELQEEFRAELLVLQSSEEYILLGKCPLVAIFFSTHSVGIKGHFYSGSSIVEENQFL